MLMVELVLVALASPGTSRWLLLGPAGPGAARWLLLLLLPLVLEVEPVIEPVLELVPVRAVRSSCC